jgi:anti-sigma factor RsiW
MLRRHELVCQEVVELVSDYLEDALSARDRRRFERHIAGCEHCTAYLSQMRVTLRLTGRLAPGDLSPEARDELSEVFRHWKSGQDSGGRD